MKKLFLLLFIVLIYSCSMIDEDVNGWFYISDDSNIPEKYQSFEDIYIYIHCPRYFTWKSNKNKDTQLPQETLDKMSGNCVEQTLLILALVKKRQHGYKGQLVIGCLNGNIVNHAEPRCHGKIIDSGKFKETITVEFDDIAEKIKQHNSIY